MITIRFTRGTQVQVVNETRSLPQILKQLADRGFMKDRGGRRYFEDDRWHAYFYRKNEQGIITLARVSW